MNRLRGDPTTCPHGNPIPGAAYTTPDTVVLARVPVATAFVVARIPEELEFTPGLLEFLEGASLRPCTAGEVTAAAPDGTVTVRIDGREIGIGTFASERILVLAGAEALPV